MTGARFFVIFVAGLLLGAPVDGQTIMPGADVWVVTTDIPPFVVDKASIEEGGAGLYTSFLGNHPDNVDAGAIYEDESRGMTIGVRVVRQADTAYIDHFLESPFRSHKTGRILAGAAIAEHGGQRLLFYCSNGPNCEDRVYAWRSGPDTVVRLDGKAFIDVGPPSGAPDPRRTPCPEPTEILDEYLDRYASSVGAPPANGDDSAKQWLRDRLAVMLASADLRVAAAAGAAENARGQALYEARAALFRWAQQREDVFGKPSAQREAERLQSIEKLPADAQIREIETLRDQYRAWWTSHQNDPIELPPP